VYLDKQNIWKSYSWGPQPYLSRKEELVETAKAGYGKSRQQIKTIAENVARDKGVLGAYQMGRFAISWRGKITLSYVRMIQLPM